ncbi:MAG: ABC transporter permease [Gemmatimonadetes bacterium]|nr:ABC transporter permease [Gemmatimonadota bacterium]
MQFFEGIRLAFEQIRSQKLKSFFSLLGVIIGVMFLVLVVGIVEGMDRYIRDTLTEKIFGVNTVTVRRTPRIQVNTSRAQARAWRRAPRLTYDDLDYITRNLTLPATVAVESGTSGELEADNGRTVENVQIRGASAEIFEIRPWTPERGRAYTRQEATRGVPVVVLGKSTADVLFEELDPIGRNVRIRGFPYRVIGVLEEQGSFLGQSLDNIAVAPDRSPVKSFTNPRGIVDQIIVKSPDPAGVPALRAQVEEIMRVRRRLRPAMENNFQVETTESSLTFWDNISRVLFVALPGLVAISLVVGGIVIMNIMLVSVMERTREIGVRKAIGARRRDILIQVMIETATLSGFGAVMGAAIGAGLTVFVGAVSPMPAVVATKWILAGVLLGITVGMVSGVYPAARASRLHPVDALRYE